MVMVTTVRVMQTQQCIYVLASIVVVSIVLDSTVVDSTVLASTNAEILGYIVRYWKILGPVICQFAFLAIRRFCQFCRIITPLEHAMLVYNFFYIFLASSELGLGPIVFVNFLSYQFRYLENNKK